uniref:dUTP diphosphatase n=1 Tax=Arundo donax TaxID=35708 RepID=A0A0A9DLL3_ARUDO
MTASNGAAATDSVHEPPQKIPKITPLLKVKKLSDKAVLPSRGSALAAGYDLSSAVETVVPARGKALVPTDLSIAIPEGTYARIGERPIFSPSASRFLFGFARAAGV